MNLSRSEWKRMLKKMPMIVVDGILIEKNSVLLVERKTPPFLGYMALPGGFVDYKERLSRAVIREVFEETGLRTRVVRIVGVYDDPKRDPRGHIISVAFLLKKSGGKIRGSGETRNVRFFPLDSLPERIGGDHSQMIKDAAKMLKKADKSACD